MWSVHCVFICYDLALIDYHLNAGFAVHAIWFYCFFNCRFQLENNQKVTVQDYFLHKKNVTLKCPYFPCLHVGSMKRETPIYLPSEVRKILFLMNEWLHSKSSTHDIRRGMIGCMYLPFHEICYKITSEGRCCNYHHHHHPLMFPPVLVILCKVFYMQIFQVLDVTLCCWVSGSQCFKR